MTLVLAFVDTCRFNAFRLFRCFQSPSTKGKLAVSKSTHRIKQKKRQCNCVVLQEFLLTEQQNTTKLFGFVFSECTDHCNSNTTDQIYIEVENFNYLCVFIDAVSWSLFFMFSLEWFIDWSLVLNTGAWMFDAKPLLERIPSFFYLIFHFHSLRLALNTLTNYMQKSTRCPFGTHPLVHWHCLISTVV